MTNRRNFIKTGLLTGLSASLSPMGLKALEVPEMLGEGKNTTPRFWVWVNPDPKESETDLSKRYQKYRKAGIGGIFFEADSEKHFRMAKAHGMEAHRWIWTLNRGEKSLLESHPEWYALNRKGESCSDKPPYVGYYRWLCPSREEVQQYLLDVMRVQLEKDYVDGIHLDYIRYCDVVLPVNLWKTYDIVQTRELPEYDYCYCNVCKEKFRDWTGTDLDSIEYPEAGLSWRQYRYDAVTRLVNRIALLAKEKNKPLTAAVFPTPEVARRNVRQDWTNWNLDGVFPMIYHGFYKEKVSWIGNAVSEGVHCIHGNFPLYAGLFIPDFKDGKELKEGVGYALKNGAKGVSLFGDITDEILKIIEEIDKK